MTENNKEENRRKLLQFAKEVVGSPVEYKYSPAGSEDSTWDLLETSKPKFDKDGNITKYPIPYSNRSNLALILENDSRFSTLAYNDHSDQMLWGDSILEDPHLEEIGIMLERNYRYRAADRAIKSGVVRVCRKNIKEPIKDYLDNLPQWDGVSRVFNILEGVYHADFHPKYQKLIQSMSKCFFLSAVARIYDPGAEVHSCLSLISTTKGVGKGFSLKVLAGEENFSNSPLEIGTKKGYMQIHQSGVWIWEIAEMASLQGKSAEMSKAFFTGAWDRYVPSYAHFPVHRPRRTIFALSSNNVQILSDGPERRYHPIRVKEGMKINIDYLREHRDQIWAESVHLYKQKIPWWFAKRTEAGDLVPDENLEEMLREYQEIFIIDDPWACTVKEAILGGGATTRQIMEKLNLPEGNMHTGNSKRIAQICRDLGYSQKIESGVRIWK